MFRIIMLRRRLRHIIMFTSRMWLLALMSISSVAIHAVWFYLSESSVQADLSWQDALWVSLVSVTTIGYGDFYAQTEMGRWGLLFLIIFGLAPAAGFLASLPDTLTHMRVRRERGMVPINAKNHILIVHFPNQKKVATVISELLADPLSSGVAYVVIAENIERLPDEIISLGDVRFIHGSPLSAEVLERANLHFAARALVLAPTSDDPNADGITASVVHMIESLAPDVHTVAECMDDAHLPLFETTGCDAVVRSGGVIASLMAQAALDPGVPRIVRHLINNTKEQTFYTFTTSLVGRSLGEVNEGFRSEGIAIIGVIRDDSDAINPPDSWTLEEGDRLCVISPSRQNWAAVESRVISGL